MNDLIKLVALDHDVMMDCGAGIEQALGIVTCARLLSTTDAAHIDIEARYKLQIFEKHLEALNQRFKPWRSVNSIEVHGSLIEEITAKLALIDEALNEWLEDSGVEQEELTVRISLVNSLFAASQIVFNALRAFSRNGIKPPAIAA